jgi:hypothetical protein
MQKIEEIIKDMKKEFITISKNENKEVDWLFMRLKEIKSEIDIIKKKTISLEGLERLVEILTHFYEFSAIDKIIDDGNIYTVIHSDIEIQNGSLERYCGLEVTFPKIALLNPTLYYDFEKERKNIESSQRSVKNSEESLQKKIKEVEALQNAYNKDGGTTIKKMLDNAIKSRDYEITFLEQYQKTFERVQETVKKWKKFEAENTNDEDKE